ncbi:nucleoside hydrolase [Chimaeribacter arupi]|uniref:Nucleoside hydrolase n=1 Tax=Nissabacter archeti TaxID=1917880 RepID=A0ABS5JI07_9GAMM|nr:MULTISPECIES: nucleoside hydrolase [Yersiniaceae]MBS0969614.1 nucleoside hydrolase [Nissabacter archeti]PLR44094.1 nucleoside hydrolase [Chimaeribacter arupi]
MAAHRIILDCDPGVDDAVAILLALASPQEITLAGITTVAGNVSATLTEYNARRICTLANRHDIPVFSGCPRPMRDLHGYHTQVHGHDGLGGVPLPEPGFALQRPHAVDFIIETINAEPAEITLCAIGPLTNIALALIKDPGIAPKIKQLVLMGGAAFCPGNVSPAAEFNLYVDPWAAHVVLSAGIPQVMFGLDVTSQAQMSAAWLDALHQRNATGATLAAMMRSYGAADPCLHDPCVIAWLIDPTLFSGVDGHVSVVTEGAAAGQTLAAVKPRHLAGRTPNTRIMTQVDNPRLLALLAARLAGY